MPSDSLDFISTAGKIQLISSLESMQQRSTDNDYIDYCHYCLDIVRQGIELNYYEVLDFIGVTGETVPAEVSIEVVFLMEMFDHISISLSVLPEAEANAAALEYYTKFCGFEASLSAHLSYYIFLVRTNKYRVPIFKEGLPLTLSHYREMMLTYERYKRNLYLTKDMIRDICIRREQQIFIIRKNRG
ncbi:YfbU family protein [Jeotgalicoccus sp. WY2]|uniref:YfbU family protein n=1 Tax=Jeotgalicoccus sp. WY2 TaxID=2708346 RepID=UPI001BD6C2E8|nr:YfbU family protein [Jeotgalicoccus sp. WY2]